MIIVFRALDLDASPLIVCSLLKTVRLLRTHGLH